MRKLTIILTFFVLTQSAFALMHDPKNGTDHSHHSYDTRQARTWKLSNMSVITTGTFLLAREGKIWIENESGILTIPIEELSWIDQRYVTRKLKEIEVINSKLRVPVPQKAYQPNGWLKYTAALSILLVLILAGYLIGHKSMEHKPSQKNTDTFSLNRMKA